MPWGKPAAPNLRSPHSTSAAAPVFPRRPSPASAGRSAVERAPRRSVRALATVGDRCHREGMEHLSTQDVIDAGLADWRKLAQRLHARFRVADAAAGAAFVADAVRTASASFLGQHLEATVTPAHVDFRVATHLGRDGIWVTSDDVALARLVSEVAHRHHVISAPAEVTQVELGLDTAHQDAARTVLGGGAHRQHGGPRPRHRPRPHGPGCRRCGSRGPRSTTCPVSGGTPTCGSRPRRPRPGSRQRSPPVAPSSTTPRHRPSRSLADPDGNKVCVCTFLDRG